MTPPLVSIRDLHVSLGGNPILRGLDADITRGQITALIGLNGSGKTTLLKAILKEVPCAGRIEFHCGHDHTRQEPGTGGRGARRQRRQPVIRLNDMAARGRAADEAEHRRRHLEGAGTEHGAAHGRAGRHPGGAIDLYRGGRPAIDNVGVACNAFEPVVAGYA